MRGTPTQTKTTKKKKKKKTPTTTDSTGPRKKYGHGDTSDLQLLQVYPGAFRKQHRGYGDELEARRGGGERLNSIRVLQGYKESI